MLRSVEDACFQAEPEILLQPRSEMVFPLWLVEIMVSAHFGFIVRAAPDIDCSAVTDSAEGRIPVAGGCKHWAHARRIRFRNRLAAVPARDPRARRREGEARAALLAPPRQYGCRPFGRIVALSHGRQEDGIGGEIDRI